MLDISDCLERARVAAARSDAFAALPHLLAVLDAKPPLGQKWRDVANSATQLQLLDVAASAARCFYAETRPTPESAAFLARTLLAAGDAEEAVRVLAAYASAGKLSPNDRFLLARLYAFTGVFAEAEHLLRELIALAPDNPFGWELLAQGKKFGVCDADIEAMETLRQRLAGSTAQSRAAINYALGKAYVDVGDDRRAAQVLDDANRAQIGTARFDAASIEHAERLAIDLIEEREFDLPGSEHGARAIFVLGPPRSGTSLVEQILGSHSLVAAGGELNFLWLAARGMGEMSRGAAQAYVARAGDQAWRQMGDNYLKLASMRFPTRQRFTDKLLTNHWRAGAIRRALPDAQIVWCRRDPLDVAWSCWRANFAHDSIWSCDPDLIARFVASYERVMRALVRQAPDSVVEIEYEALVRAPEVEIPQLLGALNLGDEPETRSPHQSTRTVSTSSFAQVREPISSVRVGAVDRFPIATARLREALERYQAS